MPGFHWLSTVQFDCHVLTSIHRLFVLPLFTPLPPQSVVTAARAVLDSPQLIGEPRPLEDATNAPPTEDSSAAPAGGFDMGAALPVAEPSWSAAHRGLCLFASRLLHPVWEVALVRPVAKNSPVIAAVLDVVVLQVHAR